MYRTHTTTNRQKPASNGRATFAGILVAQRRIYRPGSERAHVAEPGSP
ncbi:MAG TPA: hypothetical protein VFB72_19775 [Verrucomicrobiae bacterium]|nr:hypothetical protein [Verrucomicrobiae bacterium]